LTILDEAAPARAVLATRFPVTLGRAAACQCRIERPGVWDQHATIEFVRDDGFRIRSASHALLVLNGGSITEGRLRDGDILELGTARIRFGLTETRQHTFSLREWCTWIAIAALCLTQLLLVHFVLP
jgi:predicted component of type VI protein secretion system